MRVRVETLVVVVVAVVERSSIIRLARRENRIFRMEKRFDGNLDAVASVRLTWPSPVVRV